jgi:hypothetical protein
MRRLEVPDEFRPTWTEFCPTPRGEIQTVSLHCRSPTGNQQTSCAGAVGRKAPNFAPREKEKNFGGAKTPRMTASRIMETRGRVDRRMWPLMPRHRSKSKPGRPLRPEKMRKSGLRWVTALRGNLTHLIFVRPHPS